MAVREIMHIRYLKIHSDDFDWDVIKKYLGNLRFLWRLRHI